MIDCLRWLDRPCVVVRDVHQLIERIADRGQGEQAIISLDVGVDVVRDVFAQPGIRSVLVWDDIFLLGSIQQRNDLAKHREFAGLRLLIKPLRLRQVRDALESGKRASSSVVALVAGASGHVTRRVLVVDDNETNRMVAVGLLERFGAEVYSAEDGEEAVDRAAREHFDMILMDCQMPVMDGFTATRAIRNREKTSGSYTPIVAMTAFSRSEDREACTLAGMDDFLGKPVKADELRVIMSKWLVGGEHGR
jgi:CheY-like chemotaxis protein